MQDAVEVADQVVAQAAARRGAGDDVVVGTGRRHRGSGRRPVADQVHARHTVAVDEAAGRELRAREHHRVAVRLVGAVGRHRRRLDVDMQVTGKIADLVVAQAAARGDAGRDRVVGTRRRHRGRRRRAVAEQRHADYGVGDQVRVE